MDKEITIQPIVIETETSKYRLTMFVREVAGRQIKVSLEYSTDLFDADRIERMAGHYQRLLEAVVENPEGKIWELELLTNQRSARSWWNGTIQMHTQRISVYTSCLKNRWHIRRMRWQWCLESRN